MAGVMIKGLGMCVPERRLGNSDLEKIVDTSDEWIMARTGIKERRIAGDKENTSTFAIGAAQQAIDDSGVDPKDIDLIIVATITPDNNFPSVSCLVQKNIGANNAFAFDMSAACSGFLFALTTAGQYIRSGMCKNVLVIAAETMTTLVDWEDRTTCVLFGDGAGSCILTESQGDCGIVAEYLSSQGDFSSLMEVISEKKKPLDQKTKMVKAPYISMQGQELFKVAVNSMTKAVQTVLKRANLELEDITCVVPHQANDRIISAVAKKLGCHKDKIFINIQKYGNMSAASIAVALCEAKKEGSIKSGDYVVLVTFGAGIVTAASVIKF